MGWVIVPLVIIWGLFGIWLKRGKHKTLSAQQKFVLSMFKRNLSMINKKNLFFDGVHEFVVLKKIKWSYQQERALYINVATKDGDFEHLMLIKSPKDFSKFKEGMKVKFGLVRHRSKEHIFHATRELESEFAIQEIVKRNRAMMYFTSAIFTLIIMTLLFMILKFFYII